MSIRQQKIQSLLRRELATIFQRESNILFNGRFITVTHVRITPDLANANVFLSIMASKDVKADLKMIDENNWKVRKLLGERVGKTMRIIPILTFKIDDSLDVFPVHGVGGILGTILVGVFASSELGIFSGQGLAEGIAITAQLKIQFIGVLSTLIYTAVVTYVLLKVIDAMMGLRVSRDDEEDGLDLTQHNERGYDL